MENSEALTSATSATLSLSLSHVVQLTTTLTISYTSNNFPSYNFGAIYKHDKQIVTLEHIY